MLSCSAQGQTVQTVPTLKERDLKLRLYKVGYETFPSKHAQRLLHADQHSSEDSETELNTLMLCSTLIRITNK